jgi:hypothetical protein
MNFRRIGLSAALIALPAALVTGCGGASTTPSSKSVTATTSTAAATPAPVAKLRILSPHPGAHTGPTVVVRIRVIGGGASAQHALLYQLDRRRPQRSGERLILHRLPAGHHHLLIRFDNGTHATAVLTFVVRPPAPAPAPAPPVSPTTTAAPTTTSAPAPAAPQTTTAPAAPTTTPSPTPPPASAIPQHNGGDQDADNNGGPTDGDGNI